MRKQKIRQFAADAHRMLRTAAAPYGRQAEHIAFCWFFRLTALRYLEVNVPEHWQVFGQCTDPERLMPELFARLHAEFPAAFPEDADALMQLRLPEELPEMLLAAVPAEEWRGNVQLTGWLYQYYNAEEKAQFPADAKRNEKVAAGQIHAATQVFTPEWLVQYLTENTLGKYCRETHALRYFVHTETEQTEPCNPQKLRVLDPCMGSGNILVSAFDLLVQIYAEHGIPAAQAVRPILQENLCGLDIDPHACCLTAFALLMKAKAVCPDADLSRMRLSLAHFQFPELPEPLRSTPAARTMQHSAQLGSLLKPEAPLPETEAGFPEEYCRAAELLTQTYDVVCTNPPYMSNSGMNPELSALMRTHYPDYKADLFAAFIDRCISFTAAGGRIGMLTPYVWMFIHSYQKLRLRIYDSAPPETLVQLAYSAFRDATVPVCAFTLRNAHQPDTGIYIRLSDFSSSMEIQQCKMQEAASDFNCPWRYEAGTEQFRMLPEQPAAYWLPQPLREAFRKGKPLGTYADARQGLATGCNARFLRYWFEVNAGEICRCARSRAEALESGKMWFPYNKGGDYRKWYGNDLYVVNWANDGAEIRSFCDEKGRRRSRPQNMDYYFKESFSWSLVSSSDAAFRYKPAGMIFDVSGMSCFGTQHREYLLALCNSRPAKELLKAIAPTINYQCGDIAALPVLLPEQEDCERQIAELVQENIALCRADWDSFELSMDFAAHPLLGRAVPASQGAVP